MNYKRKDSRELGMKFKSLMIRCSQGYGVVGMLYDLIDRMKQSEFYAVLFGFIADECPKALRPVLKSLSQNEMERYDNEPFYALNTAEGLCDIVVNVMMGEKVK